MSEESSPAAASGGRVVRIQAEGTREKGLLVGDTITFKLDDAETTAGLRLGAVSGGGGKDWIVEPAGDLQFKVTALKPGTHKVEGIPVLGPDGTEVGKTEEVELVIQSAIDEKDPKPQEMVPMRPPVGLDVPKGVIAGGILVVALLLALAALGLRRWMRRKRGTVSPVSAPASVDRRTPEEIAFAKLKEVEEARHVAEGRFKQYYFSVSEILKEYLGRRYRFDALESTTAELIQAMDARSLPRDLVAEVAAEFDRLDFVKFTDRVPTAEEAAEVLRHARELVSRAAPQTTRVDGEAASRAL